MQLVVVAAGIDEDVNSMQLLVVCMREAEWILCRSVELF